MGAGFPLRNALKPLAWSLARSRERAAGEGRVGDRPHGDVRPLLSPPIGMLASMPLPRYTPDHIARLKAEVFRLRAAGLSLEAICAQPGWPSRPTLRKWARADPELAAAIDGGRSVHATRPRFPFRPEVAERFLLRIRLGYPIGDLIREPDMPQRRELTAWRNREPAFAAALAASTAFADQNRRRYGATARHTRRSRMRFDQDVADRIVLAVIRGATMPQIARRPEFPTRLGLRRWRRAQPEFARVLAVAQAAGHRTRGKARVDAHCTRELTDEIGARIVEGASLHSLSKAPDTPSLYALYKWVRDRPAFAAEVAAASEFRDTLLTERALTVIERQGEAGLPTARALRKRLGQLNPHPGQRRRDRDLPSPERHRREEREG